MPSGELQYVLKGHDSYIGALAWSPDSKRLISVSADSTMRVWDSRSGHLVSKIEAHTSEVRGVAFSLDGHVFVSHSWDRTLRFWNAATLTHLATLKLLDTTSQLYNRVAFGPRGRLAASRGQNILLWNVDIDLLLGNATDTDSVRYTTAKIVLVGESGVGKTGLGWTLSHGDFQEHSSTHGQQFWVVEELGKKRADGTECEAVLWDLAGQADYRLVHSLFLADVDLGLVLFDPTNRHDPLTSVSYWLQQIRRGSRTSVPCILIGGRVDRGTATLTAAELDDYCQRQKIAGGYVPTSAKHGEGIDELKARIKAYIPWHEMTATVTTSTFKRIKELVLSVKEASGPTAVLLSPRLLQERLQSLDTKWNFDDAEMMTAIRHLETHGYVTILHGSRGDLSILLKPDLLTNLASSIVLEARRNPRGLGVLEEGRLLHGDYRFPELTGLAADVCDVLLDAATALFLKNNLCFRETFNEQTFLVFPSLINEKRSPADTVDAVEDVTYRVRGAVENVYASLVVLLGYTNMFTRTNQWQNQVQYKLGEGHVCGFQQTELGEGVCELVLYYGVATPEHTQLLFRGLFERFLERREVEISRYQPVRCPSCKERLARNVVMDQLEKNRYFSFCNACGQRLELSPPEVLTTFHPAEEQQVRAQQQIAERRTAFEVALVRVKGLLRDYGRSGAPSCFISYAWGVPQHEQWVLQLAKDLRNVGIDLSFDRWHNPPGASLSRFIDRILESRYVVVIGTPGLKKKYSAKTGDPVVAAELRLINQRLREPNEYGPTVLPLLVAGSPREALTPLLQDVVSIDFTEEPLYFMNLLNLIWRLYELPFDQPLLEELRASLMH